MTIRLSNGITIRPVATANLGLSPEIESVPAEAHRRVLDDLNRTVRERNALADRVLALTHRAALAEEERDILKRRIDRLMAEREVLMEAADVERIREVGGV